ncbi:hypothetical protein QBC47DRAFT_374069 [Echria macrotheca]|uniref:Uncharacterized protein n=1 Tax=Echria macrotheca TaxID=438768 RepID=A0AAJ0FE17_9PEZI|nr:hypothetical protein QBC47DRAFT_374069 [Echria macrotheca]
MSITTSCFYEGLKDPFDSSNTCQLASLDTTTTANMCHHARMIWSCGHSTWLGVFRVCSAEIEFEKGWRNEGCSVMWSHSRATYRSPKRCQKCLSKQAKTAMCVAELKERLRVLRENLDERLSGYIKPKDDDDSASDLVDHPSLDTETKELEEDMEFTDSDMDFMGSATRAEEEPQGPPEFETEPGRVAEGDDKDQFEVCIQQAPCWSINRTLMVSRSTSATTTVGP